VRFSAESGYDAGQSEKVVMIKPISQGSARIGVCASWPKTLIAARTSEPALSAVTSLSTSDGSDESAGSGEIVGAVPRDSCSFRSDSRLAAFTVGGCSSFPTLNLKFPHWLFWQGCGEALSRLAFALERHN